MTSHTTEQFRKLFTELPKEIHKQAKEAYTHFKKTIIIQGYTSSVYILQGRFIQPVFQKITVLLGYSRTVK